MNGAIRGWNRLIAGFVANITLIIVLSVVTLVMVFVMFGTMHEHKNVSLEAVLDAYEEYGENGVSWIRLINKDELVDPYEMTISIYFETVINENEQLYAEANRQWEELINQNNPSNAFAISKLEREMQRYASTIETASRRLNNISKVSGLEENSPYYPDARYDFIGEYKDPSKWVYIAVVDSYAWLMAILFGVAALILKLTGGFSGIKSGKQAVRYARKRHAIFSSKVSSRQQDAEKICFEMNFEQRKMECIKRLAKVSLRYEDVFDENGVFLPIPNLIKVQKIEEVKPDGSIRYRDNLYDKLTLKRQKKTIKQLQRLKLKEIHIHNLLQSSEETKDRFDYGPTIAAHTFKSIIVNIITSTATIIPLFGVAAILVFQPTLTNIVLGIAGSVAGLVGMFWNAASNHNFIENRWAPFLQKKSDDLSTICQRLGLLDEAEAEYLRWMKEDGEIARRAEEELRNKKRKIKEEI